jgi:hypothetical protein
MKLAATSAVVLLVATFVPAAHAQVIGPLRWQLVPFCNVVTVTVTPGLGHYTVQGTDDQCGGAASPAGTIGLAFPLPSGDIGMSLTTVLTPGATPLHLEVALSVATLHGAWRDSAGHSGSFAFTPGAPIPGGVRSVGPNGLRPGSVTSTQLAFGAVGSASIAGGAITASKIAANTINSSALIAPGTIELSDLNQQLDVSSGAFWSIPAGGCVARETTAFMASVQEGDLLLTRIQVGPVGVFALPAVAGANGRFGYVVCNPSAVAIANEVISVSFRRVPR